ncbi:MAG: hypothetical protein IKZ34_02085 [Alphaproteobacteria bacterium]|nr:hypothetical protein [Alphaproteobacteria bacterium]
MYKAKKFTEQEQLKIIKFIYFLCSIRILFIIFNALVGFGSAVVQPWSRYASGHAIGEIFGSIVVFALSYGYLMLNYYFIKAAYKNKSKDIKFIAMFSCLPGLVLLLPYPYGAIGLPFLLIAPIINACVTYEGKKKQK